MVRAQLEDARLHALLHQALAAELNAMADLCEHWPALWQQARRAL